MDVVVVTYGPDLKLLRHMVASLELYYRGEGKLFVISSKDDSYILERIRFPANTEIVFREDFPEVSGADPFKQHLYLKLRAYELVTTEDFLLLDSDFVFINPVDDADFYKDGVPIWYYRPWSAGDPATAWHGCDDFLSFKLPLIYMNTPQYIFKRHICRALATRHDLLQVLNADNLSEYMIYGAFAHRYFPSEYLFLDATSPEIPPLAGKVNQIPPSYCHLDPSCSYQEFQQYKYVAFWSHWELAEPKMVEFFEDSQRDRFGSVVAAASREHLPLAVPPGDFQPSWHRYMDGLYNDGWVSDRLAFDVLTAQAPCAVQLTVSVPANPDDPSWSLRGAAEVQPGGTNEQFNLSPGEASIDVPLAATSADGSSRIEITFAPGFHYANNPDQREFRALLRSLRLEPQNNSDR